MSTHAKGRIKISRSDRIASARFGLEESTGYILALVRRNEFIGHPVTPLETKLRKQRDRKIRLELARAQRALVKIETAANAPARRPV